MMMADRSGEPVAPSSSFWKPMPYKFHEGRRHMTHLRVDCTTGENSVVDEVATQTLRAQTDLQTIGIRDIQLLVPCGSGGGCGADTLPGGSEVTSALSGITDRSKNYDPTLCADARTDPGRGTPLSPINSGWCAAVVTNNGQQANAVWLFTLNGQLFPTVTVGSGRNQLWHSGISAPLSAMCWSWWTRTTPRRSFRSV
jgi:hypothetical protein